MADNWSLESAKEMSDRQFEKWRNLLEERIGMQLPDSRRTFLQTSLGIRMREVGCKEYEEYYEHVLDGTQGVIEWTTLVDRLTVQETRFFRDPSSCRLVQDYLNSQKDQSRTINIWSVGCATGEEPYSLSIIANESIPRPSGDDFSKFSVTATDISQPALNKANAGIYHERKLVELSDKVRDRYFSRQGFNMHVEEQMKSRVCFVRLNVLELEKSPLADFDVIYCQNLLIYFRRWRRKEIANKLAEKLVPGGLLVLGSGELVDWNPEKLTRIPSEQTLAYLKRKN